MIRNRLKEIMAIKSITSNRVHEDTGISKSTISKISNNITNMIELNTIDKLCGYLRITPAEFFDYYPGAINNLDIRIESIEETGDIEITAEITIDDTESIHSFKLSGIFELVEKELADSIRDNTKENDIAFVMGQFKFTKNKGYNFIRNLSFNAQELVIYSIAKEIHKVIKRDYHIEIVGVFLNI